MSQENIRNFWSFFIDDSEDVEFFKIGSNALVSTNEIDHKYGQDSQISKFLEEEVNDPKEDSHKKEIIVKKSEPQLQIFRQHANLTQNKNVAKFVARLFLKYHKNFDELPRNSSRINEINKAQQNYEALANIQLNFYKAIFSQSRFSQTNRIILHKILGDVQILNAELFFNGNLKNKKDYLYACKLIRLRCLSKDLIQRTQSR